MVMTAACWIKPVTINVYRWSREYRDTVWESMHTYIHDFTMHPLTAFPKLLTCSPCWGTTTWVTSHRQLDHAWGPLLSDCWREIHTKPPHLASFCEIPFCPGDLIKISRAVSEGPKGSWDLERDRRCPVGDSERGSPELSALCLYHIAH